MNVLKGCVIIDKTIYYNKEKKKITFNLCTKSFSQPMKLETNLICIHWKIEIGVNLFEISLSKEKDQKRARGSEWDNG